MDIVDDMDFVDYVDEEGLSIGWGFLIPLGGSLCLLRALCATFYEIVLRNNGPR